MLVSIFYTLTTACLMIAIYLFPKTSKTQNAFAWLPVTVLLFECYIGVCMGIFTIFHIPVGLVSAGTIALLSSVPLWRIILIKGHQKYCFNVEDTIFFIIITFGVILLGAGRFTAEKPIVYATSDPAVHLLMAKDVLISRTVLSSGTGMYMGQLTNALFIDWLSPIFPNVSAVFSFEIKDIINLWLSGTMFYSMLRRLLENRFSRWVAVIFSIVYTLGYPWNNQLFGFVYLGMSVSMATLVAFGIEEWFAGDMSPFYSLLLVSLGCFGVALSYTLFAPPVFIAVFICIVRKLYVDKMLLSEGKFLSKYFWSYQMFTFIVPSFMTIIFIIIIPRNEGNTINILNAMSAEGYIFRNLFLDTAIYLPFAFYALYITFRRKIWHQNSILLPILLFYVITFFLLMKDGTVSTYYYYKLNFLVWMVVLALSCRAIVCIAKYVRGYVTSFIICWLTIALFGLSQADANLYFENVLFNPIPAATSMFKIYENNLQLFCTENNVIFGKDYIDIVREVSLRYREDGKSILIITDIYEAQFWYEAMTDQRIYFDKEFSQEKQSRYILVDIASKAYIEDREKYNNYLWVYSNEYGFIADTLSTTNRLK